MKASHFKLYLAVFFMMLGKSAFDIHLFSTYFSTHHSSYDIAVTFAYAAIASLLAVSLFNYLQRAFRFGLAIFLNYILLTAVIISYLLFATGKLSYVNLTILASINIPLNFLILLTIRGLQARLGADKLKIVERNSNVSGNTALLISGMLFIIFFDALKGELSGPYPMTIFSLTTLATSAFFILRLLNKDKKASEILDNMQEIRVKQNIFKLIGSSYFVSILIIAALAALTIVLVYSLYVRVTIIKYEAAIDLAKMFAIAVLIYSFISNAYEFFLKERAFYNFSIKIHLILMPLVVITFGVLFLINTFYFKITEENELFFFIPILASVFLIFSQFSFTNLLLPVIHMLYLPLEEQNQNDFYIKSCYWGFTLGIGLAAAMEFYILPKLHFINNSGYVILAIGIVLLLILMNRFLIYRNYKTALQSKLKKEAGNNSSIKSFVDTIIDNIKTYPGTSMVRLINFLYTINPVKTKKTIHQLALSDDILKQRTGIISAMRFYLLELHESMLEISSTKYFPSSPNRDKIEQLLDRFEEVKNKMKKSYYIQQLSISKNTIERVHGGILADYAPQNQQYEILERLVKDRELPVAKNAIISAAGFKEKDIIKSIIKKLEIEELSNAAYASLLYVDEEAPDILEEAFYKTGQSEKVQLRIIRLLGDIANEKAVEYLLKKLSYTNQNIISASLQALSKTHFSLPEKKAVIIRHELEEVCKYIVWNSSLLLDLERYDAVDILLEAMNVEIEYNYKSLFDLLSLLFNPGSIDLIRKNLWNSDYEKVAFALELASLIITDELKPMILPLIRPMSNSERVKKMQTIFTTEKMTERDILYDIIQRDYKWINPWTKACAIMEVARIEKQEDLSLLLANMVNPDPMIAELSALSVRTLDKRAYIENKKILDKEFTEIIGQRSIETIENYHTRKEKQMPVLKFEIIKYLQKIDEFSDIPGEVLKYITDIVEPAYHTTGDVIVTIDNIDISSFHYIVYEGRVEMQINNVPVNVFDQGSFISSLDLLIDYNAEISLVATMDVGLYKINPTKFAYILSFYDEILNSIIKNTTANRTAIYNEVLKNEKRYRKRNYRMVV